MSEQYTYSMASSVAGLQHGQGPDRLVVPEYNTQHIYVLRVQYICVCAVRAVRTAAEVPRVAPRGATSIYMCCVL